MRVFVSLNSISNDTTSAIVHGTTTTTSSNSPATSTTATAVAVLDVRQKQGVVDIVGSSSGSSSSSSSAVAAALVSTSVFAAAAKAVVFTTAAERNIRRAERRRRARAAKRVAGNGSQGQSSSPSSLSPCLPLTKDQEHRVQIRLANAERAVHQAQQAVLRAKEQLERSNSTFQTQASITSSATATAIAKASAAVNAAAASGAASSSAVLVEGAEKSSTSVVVVDWSDLSLSLHQRQPVRCWFVGGHGYDQDSETDATVEDKGKGKKGDKSQGQKGLNLKLNQQCHQMGRRTHFDLCGQHWHRLEALSFGHVEQLRKTMTQHHAIQYLKKEQAITVETMAQTETTTTTAKDVATLIGGGYNGYLLK